MRCARYINFSKRKDQSRSRGREMNIDHSVAAARQARSQLSQEIDHRGIYLRRALLLDPMAAVGEYELAA
jgi:hypothetical protein